MNGPSTTSRYVADGPSTTLRPGQQIPAGAAGKEHYARNRAARTGRRHRSARDVPGTAKFRVPALRVKPGARTPQDACLPIRPTAKKNRPLTASTPYWGQTKRQIGHRAYEANGSDSCDCRPPGLELLHSGYFRNRLLAAAERKADNAVVTSTRLSGGRPSST
jgi:hypothetical protein